MSSSRAPVRLRSALAAAGALAALAVFVAGFAYGAWSAER